MPVFRLGPADHRLADDAIWIGRLIGPPTLGQRFKSARPPYPLRAACFGGELVTAGAWVGGLVGSWGGCRRGGLLVRSEACCAARGHAGWLAVHEPV